MNLKLNRLTFSAAFEGPDCSSGKLSAEEELLLQSYPQPCGPGALPDWQPQPHGSINTISCSHVIFSRTLQMLQRTNEATAAVLSLLEELVPLLALEDGTCGIHSLCERIREYLTQLAQALDAQILGNSNGGASALQNETVPVLGCTSVHILSLIMRCASELCDCFWDCSDMCCNVVSIPSAMGTCLRYLVQCECFQGCCAMLWPAANPNRYVL